jgi:hypothetical protein
MNDPAYPNTENIPDDCGNYSPHSSIANSFSPLSPSHSLFKTFIRDLRTDLEKDGDSIDAVHLSAPRTQPPPLSSAKVYESAYINDLFKEFSPKDDSALIDVFINSVNTIKCHQEHIAQLRLLLNEVYDICGKPQMIHIKNFDRLLKPTGAFSIEDQVNTLFFDACIPISWKIYVNHITNNTSKQLDVSIAMENYIIKEKAKERLNTYFKQHYSNTIYTT